MAKTAAQMLVLVDEAIEAVLVGGQSYKIGNRDFTRADLDELRKMRGYYAILADRQADATGGTELASFGDPL